MAGLVAFLRGKEVALSAEQAARAQAAKPNPRGIVLDLTIIDAIVLQVGTRIVTVTPTQVLDALDSAIPLVIQQRKF